MAAAQVAKKLKDKRQMRTLEEIFKKVNIIFETRKTWSHAAYYSYNMIFRWTKTTAAVYQWRNTLKYLKCTE